MESIPSAAISFPARSKTKSLSATPRSIPGTSFPELLAQAGNDISRARKDVWVASKDAKGPARRAARA